MKHTRNAVSLAPVRKGIWSLPMVALALVLHLGTAAAPAPRAAVNASMVIKVTDRDQVADTLVKKAESLEGYFASRTDQAVTLKVPIDQVKTLISFAEAQGVVIERGYNAQDMGFQLDQAKANLASREAMLDKYFAVIREAGPDGVLQVEQEISRLVNEIENLKGQIQLMEHRLGFAQVDISFQFRDRAAPTRDGRSSFRWLNTMNLQDLVEDFRHER